MRNIKKIIAALLCLFVAAESVFACMTIIVGKDVSSTGYVIVGHNEDDGGRSRVEHGWVDAATWPRGTTLPAEAGRAAIPQVSKTYGYFWSQVKGASGGFSNADAFLNENGVWLVSNSNASSKENTNDASRVTNGGIEYNLRRVVAERATSARDAMEIIVDMIETWGYAPSGRAYTVADKDEAWMIQIVSGKHYVAARCPDDQVIVMPNHYTIHDIFDMGFTEIIVSDDLVDYAVSKGWQKASEEFDFAKAYQAAGSYKAAGNTYRENFAISRLINEFYNDDEYPFCVVPATKVTPEEVMSILCDHYEGEYVAEDYLNASSPGLGPHDTTLRRICTGTTEESTVCEFNEYELTTTLWTAFGRGCELPYIPLHPLTKILPKEIDTMEDSAKQMADHLKPNAEMHVWQDTGWQAFREFENSIDLVYADKIDTFNKIKLNLEYRQGLKSDAAIEKAIEYIEAGKESVAVKILAEADQKATTEALEILNGFKDTFPAAIIDPIEINRDNPGSVVTIKFTADGTPIESSMIFGMGFQNTRTVYVSPIEGSLVNLGGSTWAVSFPAADLAKRSTCKGVFEHYLGGIFMDGRSFVGETFVNFI